MVYAIKSDVTDIGHWRGRVAYAMRSAMLAHEAGLVFLAQRRLRNTNTWHYEATRISAPTAKVLRLGEYA